MNSLVLSLIFLSSLILGSIMNKYVMKDEMVNGAMCLDGSPMYYYFSAADSIKDQNNWALYMGWGGWCYSALNCWHRSKTAKGSSLDQFWDQTTDLWGYLSDDCTENPDFCNWNRVWIGYCDGNSYLSNITDPIYVNDEPVYYRGFQNLISAINTLKRLHGLDQAQQVMITGCSAGGLSTILHADYIRTLLPSTVTVYKAVTCSGFFPTFDNVENLPIFTNQMYGVYYTHQARKGMNPLCLKDKTSIDEWLCNTSPESLKYVQTPIFLLETNYDAWSMDCILTAEINGNQTLTDGNCSAASGWKPCAINPDNCTNQQISQINGWGIKITKLLQSIPTVNRNGNGGFVHSCCRHCWALDDGYTNVKIGGTTIRNALSAWWKSSNESAANHWYWPCYYSENSTPRQCNPTCPTDCEDYS